MRYIIKGKTSASIVLEYDENGLLNRLEFIDNTAEQINFMLLKIPVEETELRAFVEIRKLKLHLVQQDLSFAAFWNAFAYKNGKKARAERLWKALSKIECEQVFIAIPRYRRFIAFKNQDSAYPETWLFNRMWENDNILK